jgi:hypothetical protein
MRKTRRNRGRNAEFYVIELTPTVDQPTNFQTGEELTVEQGDNVRSLLYTLHTPHFTKGDKVSFVTANLFSAWTTEPKTQR